MWVKLLLPNPQSIKLQMLPNSAIVKILIPLYEWKLIINNHLFQVIFPTGTFVKIMLHNYGLWFINLEVYPTVADVSSTSGLCGFLDNDKTNDLRLRNGSQESIHSNPPD